jgi:site-specific recombinase XerD
MKNIGNKAPFRAPVLQSAQADKPEASAAKPKRPAAKRRDLDDSLYLEQTEIGRFFKAIESKRDRAMFRLVYHRGLRAHEIGLLQLADWRNRDGVLYVRRGKGSISREHSVTKEECMAVRAWLKLRGSAPGALFPSRQGQAITRQRLDQLMKRYCVAAGIRREKAHMHALKHSCGTHLRERGETADVIQDWLGHRDSKSTDIYMHFTKTRRAESVARNRDWR